jgi:transposase
MLRKQDIKILTKLLDLKDVKVILYRIHDGIGMILQTEPTKSHSICTRCGTKSHRLHQNHRYIVKHLPFGERTRNQSFMLIASP